MPKLVDVTLQQIACTANDFGDPVQLTGDLFGATFNNDPNNPGDLNARKEIFPFPSGPITITNGQVVPITMNAITFTLAAPDVGPDQTPKFLKVGGALGLGLGSQFFTIKFDDALPDLRGEGDLPPQPPRKFNLAYADANLQITLTFGAGLNQVF
jgi:hypothetical protein